VGQEIKKDQKIGTVAVNNDGVSELQFQIWDTDNKNYNPEEWLKK
jgi:hypothetical protein